LEKEHEERTLTPVDIEHQAFESQKFGGYNTEEVDRFMAKVVRDFEKIISENAEIKERLDFLNERLLGYQKLEESLKAALQAAQSTAQDYVDVKKKEADLLLRESKVEADRIRDGAQREKSAIERQNYELLQSRSRFRAEFKALLGSYLEMLADSEKNEPADMPPSSSREG
jgi:cell division initiation protein